MRMRIVGLGLLAVGLCVAVSSLAAEGDAKGHEGHGKRGKGGGDMAARFTAADTNGDGVLSLDEFKAMHAKRQEAMKARLGDKYDATKEQSAEDLFKKLDTDGNGSVSKEELAAGHKMPAGDKGAAKVEEAAPKAVEAAQ